MKTKIILLQKHRTKNQWNQRNRYRKGNKYDIYVGFINICFSDISLLQMISFVL